MQTGVILYYFVGPVHVHNLELIAGQMPGWEFRGAYEADVSWFTSEQMNALRFETIPLSGDHIPESLWSGEVRAIIFSTAQLRKVPVNLLQQAMQRNVPTIAIEESIQIALNGGRINNYLLPVDHLLVASEIEREGMMAAGVPEQNIQITGWPFYSGQVGKTSPERIGASKAQLGLDPDRPVAALTLTALGDAGESPEARRRQLSLAASGLPGDHQLVVKPHPIEPLATLEPFIRKFAPRATVLSGNVPISELLQATDVLLNRGVSQVCFEALLREIPVIILDTGIRTPFHGLVPDRLIVSDASDLPRALEKISGGGDTMEVYQTFMASHLPYPPEQARKLTCERIAQIASQRGGSKAGERQWFDLALCQAWVGCLDEAVSILARCQGSEFQAHALALSRLVQHQAAPNDLTALRRFLGPGFRQAILQSLWIQQIDTRGGKPSAGEIEWLQDFPPTTNTSWFVPLTRQWAAVLIRYNANEALRAFTERLAREFTREAGMDALIGHLWEYQRNLFGRIKYYVYRIGLAVREMSRPVRRSLIKLLLRRKK